MSVAGWMNQQQQFAIDYLREENRVLKEQLGCRRLRLNDDQRRRLAAKAKRLGRRILAEVASIVTPETLLAWHRQLIAHDDMESARQRVSAGSASWANDHELSKCIVAFRATDSNTTHFLHRQPR